MEAKQKLALLEEMMDLDAGALTPQTVLADLDEWDSVAILSLIVLIDEQFHKVITGTYIKEFVTVADVMNIMEV